MKLITTPVNIPLFGHGLECVGSISNEPHVTGTFAEDPVTGNDGQDYAVFTVSDPEDKSFPSAWAGVYRINTSRLAVACPNVIAAG